MKHRLIAASAAALVLALLLPHASAAPGSSTLYLSQHSNDCNFPNFVLVTSSADTHECGWVPRVLLDGKGVQSTMPDLFQSERLRPLRLDATRKVTGTFTVTVANMVASTNAQQTVDAVGLVAATLTIFLGQTRLGEVRVEGRVTPTSPVSQAFALSIPTAMGNTSVSRMSVDVLWHTCIGPGACSVRTGGPSHSRLVLPTR